MTRVVLPGPRSERRRFPRYPFKADCRLHFLDRTLTAQLSDISLGGVGLRLPLIVGSYGPMPALRWQLEGVGFFRADIRWKRDHFAGIRFEAAAHRSVTLNELIERLEAESEPLPDLQDDRAGPVQAMI